MLRVDIQNVPGTTAVMVRCHGEVDAHSFMDLEDAVNGILDEEATHIVFDLKDVPYMSSAGMGVIIGAQSEVEDGGGGVAVVGPKPAVMEVLESIGLHDTCIIAATEEEALRGLGVY